MRKINDINELRTVELNILIFIDKICRAHQLRYFMFGGTLLGAVRHKGFIPWDDDIDIAMPRVDYEKFCAILEKNYESSPYKMASPIKHSDYFYGFSKLYDTRTQLIEKQLGKAMDWMGIYVDIFPMDGFTGSKEDAAKQLSLAQQESARITNCRIFWMCSTFKLKCIRIYQFVKYTILGRDRCFKKLTEQLKHNDFDLSPWVACTNGMLGAREIMEYKYFEKTVDLDFEGHQFMAPIGWHEWLSSLFGDYMQLPPEDQRYTHPFEAYFRD